MMAGKIKVFNENFFTNLDGVYLDWELVGDGKIIQKGKYENLNVAPQGTAIIDLKYKIAEAAYKEVFLNLYYRNKKQEGLLPADWQIARDQLLVFSNPNEKINLSKSDNLRVNITDSAIKVSNNSVQFSFNRLDGLLHEYVVNGNNFIKEGFTLKPNFWRPPTDNDFGADLQKKLINWKRATHNFVLLDYDIDDSNPKIIQLKMHYSLPDVYAKLNISYELNGAGEIKVTESMLADNTQKVSMMFKFGMQMMLPKEYDQMEWYGRGPTENYWDRKDAAFVGLYKMSVGDQFFPYIRPQETGNKTDVRWVKLTDKKGTGLWLGGDTVLNISARHYLDEDLDDGLQKHNRHSAELRERDLTTLNIDLQQTGVGGINSWGSLPLKQYRLEYKNYSYSFVIIPVSFTH
jgi:beta-galactosidase